MKRGTAQKLKEMALACTRAVDESVSYVQKNASKDEFQQYRRIGGRVMGHLFFEVLQPIYAEHPDLESESLKDDGGRPDRGY